MNLQFSLRMLHAVQRGCRIKRKCVKPTRGGMPRTLRMIPYA